MKNWLIIGIILISLILGFALGFILKPNNSGTINTLESQINSLEVERTTLRNEKNTLETQINNLSVHFYDLDKYDKCLIEVSSLHFDGINGSVELLFQKNIVENQAIALISQMGYAIGFKSTFGGNLFYGVNVPIGNEDEVACRFRQKEIVNFSTPGYLITTCGASGCGN